MINVTCSACVHDPAANKGVQGGLTSPPSNPQSALLFAANGKTRKKEENNKKGATAERLVLEKATGISGGVAHLNSIVSTIISTKQRPTTTFAATNSSGRASTATPGNVNRDGSKPILNSNEAI